MNKAPLANLPLCDEPADSYQRRLSVKLNEVLGVFRLIANSLIDKTTTIPVYANNAAAIAGGLAAGDFYRTGADPDPVCIVH